MIDQAADSEEHRWIAKKRKRALKQAKKDEKKKLKRLSQARAGKQKTGNVVESEREAPKSVQSVYKRATIYPKLPLKETSNRCNRFLRESDQNFDDLMQTSYKGFALKPSDWFQRSFHDSFQSALRSLESQNVYQYDITQPAGLGTKLAKTYVSRCLVGEAGVMILCSYTKL